jgi:predicted PurR-regulated permease PerM
MIEPQGGPAGPPVPESPEATEAPESGGFSLADTSGRRFGRVGLLVALLIVALLFVNVIQIFVTPVILAAVFTSLAYPIRTRLVRALGGHRGPAALLSVIVVVVVIMIPLYITATFVTVEVVALYGTAQPRAAESIARLQQFLDEVTALGWTRGLPVFGDLPIQSVRNLQWGTYIQELASTAGNAAASLINRMSRNAAVFVFNLFIVLFSMFYFFRDGDQIVARLRTLSPLDSRYEEVLLDRLALMSSATLRGQLLVGLIQSSVAGLTLWICGVKAPFLWTVVMACLSVIPMVGTWIVMYPMAVVQFLNGNVWQGVAIIAVSLLVISNIDNVLRPRLVGRHARMHDLLVFFATLGGISVYGVMGFIVGPIIAALLLGLLDIYELEFRPLLDRAAARGTLESVPDVLPDVLPDG